MAPVGCVYALSSCTCCDHLETPVVVKLTSAVMLGIPVVSIDFVATVDAVTADVRVYTLLTEPSLTSGCAC